MRCPSCGANNLADAIQCAMCETKMVRRQRRRPMPTEPPLYTATRSSTARTAYRLSMVGLIPFVGLILGPLSLVLGFIAWWWDQGGSDSPPIGPAIAAMVFGTLSLLFNWAGLFLMVYGLRSPS